MRLVLQRVKQASVTVDQRIVGSIDYGILVLFGVRKGDSQKEIPWLAQKLIHLRMFPDPGGKMNLDLKDIGGEVLIVSQFTLYADCTKGRRPAFVDAMNGEKAEKLYREFVNTIRSLTRKVETGIFGAQMDVSLVNDGPVTFIIDSKNSSSQ